MILRSIWPRSEERSDTSMILTAYFDERGTHAGAEISGMAGFLGDAKQWRKFEKRVTKLFKRFAWTYFMPSMLGGALNLLLLFDQSAC
jgi:hypothetical protein